MPDYLYSCKCGCDIESEIGKSESVLRKRELSTEALPTLTSHKSLWQLLGAAFDLQFDLLSHGGVGLG